VLRQARPRSSVRSMEPVNARWTNFRSFEDTDWIEIRPLTIVIGRNNGGKTALISPFLLLKQTFDSRTYGSGLNLRGDLINFGTFPEIVHRHDLDRTLTFSLLFSENPGTDDSDLGAMPPTRGEFTFQPAPVPTVARLSSFGLRDALGRPLLTRSLLTSGNYSLRHLKPVIEYMSRIAEFSTDPEVRARYHNAIRDASPDNFLFTGRTIYEIMSAVSVAQTPGPDSPPPDHPNHGSKWSQLSAEAFAYLGLTSYYSQNLQRLMRNISYLGPLRERFQRIYSLSGDLPRGVGKEGHNAPELLYWHKDDPVFEEVNTWIGRFEFNGELHFESAGADGFTLQLRSPDGLSINVVDAGFGLSQLIPLIVEGFASSVSTVIVAAQPEIHLNPRLQAVLGDLFVEIANTGRGVIIETHSEHLLLRVRRLVAEGAISADDVVLLYVDQADDGTSHVEDVLIDTVGDISPDSWPRGFFEDSLGEALALAQAQTNARKHAPSSRRSVK
jgi:hypothetical protein